MRSAEIEVTTARTQLADLTSPARDWLAAEGVAGDGLLHVFAPHATAGLALMELGSGSERDLTELAMRLLPRDDRYRHRHGATGHGADHLLPVLVSPSISIPVITGVPALGPWQSLVLVDFNVDNPRRRVRFSFIPG